MATTGEEKEKGMREGKSWSTPEWDEARGVSDESQGVEDGGGAAASELLAIYGSPFWPTPPLRVPFPAAGLQLGSNFFVPGPVVSNYDKYCGGDVQLPLPPPRPGKDLTSEEKSTRKAFPHGTGGYSSSREEEKNDEQTMDVKLIIIYIVRHCKYI